MRGRRRERVLAVTRWLGTDDYDYEFFHCEVNNIIRDPVTGPCRACFARSLPHGAPHVIAKLFHGQAKKGSP